jgi:PKD repeat protein
VTVTPLPSAVFTKTNTTGNTWTFSYPTAGLTYLWTFGEGTATSTAQNPTYTYTTPGVKTVKLRVTTGNGICRDSTTQTLTVTTAIKDIPALAGFRYGPNPASASLLLHTGALKADVRLLDLTGKVIANLRTRAETTSEKTVSLAQLAAGLYFLEVTTDEARGVEKLLIR